MLLYPLSLSRAQSLGSCAQRCVTDGFLLLANGCFSSRFGSCSRRSSLFYFSSQISPTICTHPKTRLLSLRVVITSSPPRYIPSPFPSIYSMGRWGKELKAMFPLTIFQALSMPLHLLANHLCPPLHHITTSCPAKLSVCECPPECAELN